MKQLSLFFLCIMLVGVAKGATISGRVTYATTGSPVVSHTVYVSDSLTYLDSALTDASGVYSITLPSFSARTLTMRAPACGLQNNGSTLYIGNPTNTYNFSICTGSPAFSLQGTVSLGGVANNGLAKIYVIRKRLDTLGSGVDTILTAVDSFITASTGGTFSKAYTSHYTDGPLLKAMLMPSHPQYANFLPTYYSSSLLWSSANELTATNYGPSTATNINMVAGTNPGGPGFIGGNVLLGANKNTGVGDPLSSRILILTRLTGQAVAYTYSNASGQFSFPNLPLGSYFIFGDAWGKSNPALTVTLTSGNQNITDVVFEENNKTFKGRIGSLGVSVPKALEGVTIFPNPVKAFVVVDGLSKVQGNKTLILRTIGGAEICRQNIEVAQDGRLAVGELAAGVYMLEVQTQAGDLHFRLTK